MRRSLQIGAFLLLLSGAAACGPRSGPAPPRQPATVVQVQNQKFLDVTVYVYSSGGQRVRLGMVPGVSTRTFTIPARLIFGTASLRFQADPIGSRETPVSHDISVQPGDTVHLVIPA